jgi:hypothetical protein
MPTACDPWPGNRNAIFFWDDVLMASVYSNGRPVAIASGIVSGKTLNPVELGDAAVSTEINQRRVQ